MSFRPLMQRLIWGCAPRPRGDGVHASLPLKYFAGTVFKAPSELHQSGFGAYKILGKTRRLRIRRHHCDWDPEAKTCSSGPCQQCCCLHYSSETLDQQRQQKREGGLCLTSTFQILCRCISVVVWDSHPES